jgi:hypothetical protein
MLRAVRAHHLVDSSSRPVTTGQDQILILTAVAGKCGNCARCAVGWKARHWKEGAGDGVRGANVPRAPKPEVKVRVRRDCPASGKENSPFLRSLRALPRALLCSPSAAEIDLPRWEKPTSEECCDALRCSGPHARYTDKASEYSLGRKVRVILLNFIVLGIGHCNYCPSTRNP